MVSVSSLVTSEDTKMYHEKSGFRRKKEQHGTIFWNRSGTAIMCMLLVTTKVWNTNCNFLIVFSFTIVVVIIIINHRMIMGSFLLVGTGGCGWFYSVFFVVIILVRQWIIVTVTQEYGIIVGCIVDLGYFGPLSVVGLTS
jgi:hypothetical protein